MVLSFQDLQWVFIKKRMSYLLLTKIEIKNLNFKHSLGEANLLLRQIPYYGAKKSGENTISPDKNI